MCVRVCVCVCVYVCVCVDFCYRSCLALATANTINFSKLSDSELLSGWLIRTWPKNQPNWREGREGIEKEGEEEEEEEEEEKGEMEESANEEDEREGPFSFARLAIRAAPLQAYYFRLCALGSC